MMIPSRRSALSLFVCIATVALVGCELVTMPQGGVEVQLSQSSPFTLDLGDGLSMSPPREVGATTWVPASLVSSIQVTVTHVHARQAGAPGTEGGCWVAMNLTEEAQRIELLALPSEGGVTIAAAGLPDGEYTELRLFVRDATITFSDAVTLSGGPNPRTLEAGTHALRIPSAEQTGISLSTPFTVGRTQLASTTVVSVALDGAASVQSLQATANGVQMSPVLRFRGP